MIEENVDELIEENERLSNELMNAKLEARLLKKGAEEAVKALNAALSLLQQR